MSIKAPPKARTIELLASGERPPIHGQSGFAWPSLIDGYVHPVKVAVVEAFRWLGGPLSARELWLIGVGDSLYINVAYHVKALADLGLLEMTHTSPIRGTAEKFYTVP